MIDSNATPRRGTIAYSSDGTLGLITENFMTVVCLGNGDGKAPSYTGIILQDNLAMGRYAGEKWSSRAPIVVGHLETTTIEVPELLPVRISVPMPA